MTYFLMLLFVYWTLLLFAYNKVWDKTPVDVRVCCSAVWATLGTFFFHNIW